MTDQASPAQEESGVSLAPVIGGIALLAAAIALAALFLLNRYLPALSPAASIEIVSFDVIKYTNAQRAVASAFLRPDADVSATNELLLNVPQRTREAIRDVAGPGTLVMLKQAVVQGQTRDITDDVLRRLGLPTNVPTADATALSLDAAPTMFFGNPAPRPAPANRARPAGTPVELP